MAAQMAPNIEKLAIRCTEIYNNIRPSEESGEDIFPVQTKSFDVTIKVACAERNDDWAHIVHGRLECAPDLHAEDAIYHQ